MLWGQYFCQVILLHSNFCKKKTHHPSLYGLVRWKICKLFECWQLSVIWWSIRHQGQPIISYAKIALSQSLRKCQNISKFCRISQYWTNSFNKNNIVIYPFYPTQLLMLEKQKKEGTSATVARRKIKSLNCRENSSSFVLLLLFQTNK